MYLNLLLGMHTAQHLKAGQYIPHLFNIKIEREIKTMSELMSRNEMLKANF